VRSNEGRHEVVDQIIDYMFSMRTAPKKEAMR